MEGRLHQASIFYMSLTGGSGIPVLRSPSMRPEVPLLTVLAAIRPDPGKGKKPFAQAVSFRPPNFGRATKRAAELTGDGYPRHAVTTFRCSKG